MLAKQYLNDDGLDIIEVMQLDQFSIKCLYSKLRDDIPRVPWRKLTCNNYGAPKWLFILNLSIHNRLYTKDKLVQWGILDNQTGVLCRKSRKQLNIFVECNFSDTRWRKMMQWLKIPRSTMAWGDEVRWTSSCMNYEGKECSWWDLQNGPSREQLLYLEGKKLERVSKQGKDWESIVRDIFCRGSLRPRLAKQLDLMNLYP